MSYNHNRRYSSPRPSRWMPLKYAAVCKVCGTTIAAGDTAFYDQEARTATCQKLPCAERDGLTRATWWGSPTSGQWVQTLTERRIGPRS